MDEDHASIIIQVFNALNSDEASTLIPLDGSPSGLLKVKEIIYSNLIVGLLGDRILDNSSEKILQCTLLGEAINCSGSNLI
jgi:predicted LPLAT superfamily acyltransferase